MSAAQAQELEFKLSIDPAATAGFWRAIGGRLPRLRPTAEPLFSAYYDTPDGTLRRNGVALRLRRDRGRWIQTIKRDGRAAAGGLHQRIEHEVEVAAQLPSFPAMADAGLNDLAADRKLREGLRVVFTTEFERTAALARPAPGTLIEVALDQGTITADGRRDTLCEVELELKAGDPGALFALARWVAATLPVRLDNRSKAERGYRLAANARPTPVKAAPSSVEDGMSASQALQHLGFQCLSQLQANEAGILAGRNPEYLHQARVALRRLRSLLRTFDALLPTRIMHPLQERLRDLGRGLGAARNLDVFAVEVLPRIGNFFHPGLLELRRRTLGARRVATRTARAVIADSAYTVLMLDLVSLLSDIGAVQTAAQAAAAAQPVTVFAQEALAHNLKRARKRARRMDALACPELHRFRIALKRLRYAMDFFQPLWPDEMPDMLERLSELQDLLGRFNDDATAWKLLDALAAESPGPDFQQAIGYVRGWTAQDAERCRGQFVHAWKQFSRMKPAWR